jgi:hypothetical protein
MQPARLFARGVGERQWNAGTLETHQKHVGSGKRQEGTGIRTRTGRCTRASGKHPGTNRQDSRDRQAGQHRHSPQAFPRQFDLSSPAWLAGSLRTEPGLPPDALGLSPPSNDQARVHFAWVNTRACPAGEAVLQFRMLSRTAFAGDAPWRNPAIFECWRLLQTLPHDNPLGCSCRAELQVYRLDWY